MELIVDNNFKQSYTLYYEKLRSEKILEAINEVFIHSDPEIVIDTVNIIKTSMTLGYSYTKCYEEILSKIANRFPDEDDIDKFILSITLKVMIAAGSSNIDEIIRKPRNILVEATAKYFKVHPRKVTSDMVASLERAYTNFVPENYSFDNEQTESWDEYFFSICRQVSRNSKCFSRKIGSVLVRDKSVISTGYNGPPRGIPRCDLRWGIDDSIDGSGLLSTEVANKCPRRLLGFKSGEGLEICTATHSEVNALVNAARLGIPTLNTTMYMTCGIPCHNCLQVIINAGVKEIVVTSLLTYDKLSLYLLDQSDLSVRVFNFIK